jgi:hypothetical protein
MQAERLPQCLCLVVLDTASWTRMMTQTVQPLPFVHVADDAMYVELLVDPDYLSLLAFILSSWPPSNVGFN